MSKSTIDLNKIATISNLKVSISSIEDEHPKDANIRRIKDITLFFLIVFLTSFSFIFCCYVILGNNFNGDEKKWAMTLAASITTGAIGFVTGKKIS